MLLRLAYLSVTNAFALLRLLPMSDRDKDVEILVLRHQITILERQLANIRPWLSAADRVFFAALLHRHPLTALRQIQLPVRPERCCAGIGTCSRATTQPGLDLNGPAGREPC